MDKSTCERLRNGLINNCALCEGANKEIYKRCKLKNRG